MTVSDDERFKAAAHGLLLGATLPVWAYNVKAGNRQNIVVYTVFVAFEVWQILGHVRKGQQI